jgi:hypothetical protein
MCFENAGGTAKGEGKVLYDYQVMSGFFLVTMVTGLLTISYWAGVSELEELGEEDDYF